MQGVVPSRCRDIVSPADIETRNGFAIVLMTGFHCHRFKSSVKKQCRSRSRLRYARQVRQVCASTRDFNGAKKLAAPLLFGRGFEGGRWPGPLVERDGERCYRGRGLAIPRGDEQHGDRRVWRCGNRPSQFGLRRYLLPIRAAIHVGSLARGFFSHASDSLSLLRWLASGTAPRAWSMSPGTASDAANVCRETCSG
jgi:hypothetical protein